FFEDELTISWSDEDEEEDEEEEDEENDEEMERKLWLIAELRKENDSNDIRFSRACRACNDEHPRGRAVFTACGHALCRQCADYVVRIFGDECWQCCAEGGSVHIYEEEEEKQEEEEKTKHRFSRFCRVCFAESPRRRAVFTACGHIICRACAWQLAIEADDWDGAPHADDAYQPREDSHNESEDEEESSGEDELQSESEEEGDEKGSAYSEDFDEEEEEQEEGLENQSDKGEERVEEMGDEENEGEEEEDDEEEFDGEWCPLRCPLCNTEGGFGPL
ncbi:hypothetical protein PMAYCL1PPCAC_26379, partial [Pristionchus mayeri]